MDMDEDFETVSPHFLNFNLIFKTIWFFMLG